jgi:malic enzyme
MAKDPIVFAMANPTPEIMPEDALGFAAVMATGRSDYPNQINNVLCFPGIFRGALNCRASRINEAMKSPLQRRSRRLSARRTPSGLHYSSVFDRRGR